MLITRRECSVRGFSPVSPNVDYNTPAILLLYNKSERSDLCFNAADAGMTIRQNNLSTLVDKNEVKRSFVAPAWRSRSEQSKPTSVSAVHIVESLTIGITLWTDGANPLDRVNGFVGIETVLRRHTSFQKRG